MSTTDSTIARLIEDDHERLRSLIAAITVDLADEPPAAFEDWKLLLLRSLRDFQNQLRKHFDLEEHGGFVDEIALRAPWHHAHASTLMREHEDLVASLDTILRDLKGIDAPTTWRESDVPARLQGLFAVLKEHEEAEATLLQDIYCQDLGVGD
jgi:hypothetical protein